MTFSQVPWAWLELDRNRLEGYRGVQQVIHLTFMIGVRVLIRVVLNKSLAIASVGIRGDVF